MIPYALFGGAFVVYVVVLFPMKRYNIFVNHYSYSKKEKGVVRRRVESIQILNIKK
jgi:hypothetical protein